MTQDIGGGCADQTAERGIDPAQDVPLALGRRGRERQMLTHQATEGAQADRVALGFGTAQQLGRTVADMGFSADSGGLHAHELVFQNQPPQELNTPFHLNDMRQRHTRAGSCRWTGRMR